MAQPQTKPETAPPQLKWPRKVRYAEFARMVSVGQMPTRAITFHDQLRTRWEGYLIPQGLMIPGAAIVHHADSFAIVRGKHLDVAVLGGLQVAENGDLANWMRPDRGVGSIGGAADIARGAKKVFVAMEHTTKDGEFKIVKTCNYPLTGASVVHSIFTDVAVIRVTPEGLVLEEAAPGWTPEDVQAITEPTLIVSPTFTEYAL